MVTVSNATIRGNSTSMYRVPAMVQRRAASPRHGEGPVEHHLRASMQRGSVGAAAVSAANAASWRCRRRTRQLPGAQVRSEADVGDPACRERLHHFHRLCDGLGSVVDRGQQVRVEVDHARGDTSRSSRGGKGAEPLGRRLSLGEQRQRDQRVGGEEIEGDRAVARPREHPLQSA